MASLTLEEDLRDAWIGEGNSKRITFLRWCREMADNPNGILKDAATRYLNERKTKQSIAKPGT